MSHLSKYKFQFQDQEQDEPNETRGPIRYSNIGGNAKFYYSHNRICLNLAKKIPSSQVVASSEFYNSLKSQIGPGFRVTCYVLRLANQIKSGKLLKVNNSRPRAPVNEENF